MARMRLARCVPPPNERDGRCGRRLGVRVPIGIEFVAREHELEADEEREDVPALEVLCGIINVSVGRRSLGCLREDMT